MRRKYKKGYLSAILTSLSSVLFASVITVRGATSLLVILGETADTTRLITYATSTPEAFGTDVGMLFLGILLIISSLKNIVRIFKLNRRIEVLEGKIIYLKRRANIKS